MTEVNQLTSKPRIDSLSGPKGPPGADTDKALPFIGADAAEQPVYDDAAVVALSDKALGSAAHEPGKDAVQSEAPTQEQPGAAQNQHADTQAVATRDRSASSQHLSSEEQKQVEQLKDRDREVRAHEQAHVAALGSYASGGAKFEFETGPDGKRYAVGGEVSLSVSAEDQPEKTIQKAQTIRRAALAPAEPSGQDRAVAAQAAQMEAKARAELAKKQTSGEDKAEKAQGEGSRHAHETRSTEDPKSSSFDEASDIEKNAPAASESVSSTASAEPTGGPSQIQDRSRALAVYPQQSDVQPKAGVSVDLSA